MTNARLQARELFRLADVQTIGQLARVLGVPLQILQEVVECRDPNLIYAKHYIPKRNPRSMDDYRLVWECREERVARSHKAVARRIDDFARRQEIGYPHVAVHGYVRGGSTRSNAQPHCGARVVVRADIEGFFPAITLTRIEEVLCTVGMRSGPAHLLASFVCINGALPLGLPESPVISNLVCLKLDEELQSFADTLGVKYTRYADDLTFSGYENLPSKEQIRAILNRQGFNLSERKFKKSKRGQSHFVTGLSVSERDYPHVPRKLKRRLRMELYFCEKYGLEFHANKIGENPRKTFLRLAGMVKYVAYIERRKAGSISGLWGRILSKLGGPTSYASVRAQGNAQRFITGDETEFDFCGVHYLAICFVRIGDLEEVEKQIDIFTGDYYTKPGAKGSLELLQEIGIHYTDAHPDLRTSTLDLMTDVLVWSASIHFARLDDRRRYKDVYIRLFNDSIRQEFITSDEVDLNILVERNDKIKLPALVAVVGAEYQRAEADGGRRPRSLPSIRCVEKPATRSLTLPDFVLAAFRNYALLVPNESVLDFERIRDRVRYVHDVDSDIYYTRKKPFVRIGSR